MKGNIIGFDPEANTGAITGHDGKRYEFATLDWHGGHPPRHGDVVDFAPDGSRAAQIYPIEPEYVQPGFLMFYFWFFIEFGCMRGTVGPNKYGPDPVPQS